MLDLQPIKDRRENAGLEYGTFIAAAPADLAALVAEVERLRDAIKAHRDHIGGMQRFLQETDEELWQTIDNSEGQ